MIIASLCIAKLVMSEILHSRQNPLDRLCSNTIEGRCEVAYEKMRTFRFIPDCVNVAKESLDRLRSQCCGSKGDEWTYGNTDIMRRVIYIVILKLQEFQDYNNVALLGQQRHSLSSGGGVFDSIASIHNKFPAVVVSSCPVLLRFHLFTSTVVRKGKVSVPTSVPAVRLDGKDYGYRII